MKKSSKHGKTGKKISDFFKKPDVTADPESLGSGAGGSGSPPARSSCGLQAENIESSGILDVVDVGTPQTENEEDADSVASKAVTCSGAGSDRGLPEVTSGPSLPESDDCLNTRGVDGAEIIDCSSDYVIVPGEDSNVNNDLQEDNEVESPEAKKAKTKKQKLAEKPCDRKRERSTQNFCASWKNQLDWVDVSKRGPTYTYCIPCDKHMSCAGGYSDLVKHATRESHIKAVKRNAEPGKIDKFVGAQDKVKVAEMQLCAWAAENNKSAVDVEQFLKISKLVFDDSDVAQGIKIGRTKATAIICNVIGASHEQELKEIMRTNQFSLIIDESTDVATKKVLVMVIRTYTWQGDKLSVRDYFYHGLELVASTAEAIYNAIVNRFREDGVPYKKNLAGFGADGCNVMHGKKNSVAVLLKNDCPNLFVLKCVCHSFALCSSYACKHIPEQVEWLCKEVHSFLSNSPLRTEKFYELQSIMDLKPLKMLHPSATRWLSLEEVVKRMLDRYEVMKIYFNYSDSSADRRVLKKMADIKSVLDDPTTILYLKFLQYVLPKVNKLNRLFQSESPQIYLLNSEVKRLYKDLLLNFMNPTYIRDVDLNKVVLDSPNYAPLDQIYMGTHVDAALGETNLQPDALYNFRLAIKQFYISLANQIKDRLNLDDPVLNNLVIIDPLNVKALKHRSLLPLLKHFPNIVPEQQVQTADDEFREVICMEEVRDLDCSDGVKFWGSILATKRCDGSFAFPILREFIPSLLSLPHSSACVERIFSIWNYNKTKVRNRLATRTMNGILCSKEYVKTHKNEQGIVNFTAETKRLFSNDMYKMKD